MSNPIVESLRAFKIPSEDRVNEETFRELIELCPAVSDIVNARQTETPINRGFLTTMGIIYDLLSGSGYEEIFKSINSEYVTRIDKLMITDKFSLTKDGQPLIPAVAELVKMKPTPWLGGILKALGCVVKRSMEDAGSAETVRAYSPPSTEAEQPEKSTAPIGKAPAADPKDSKHWSWRPDLARTTTPDYLTKILSDIHASGIPLESVSLKPEKTDKGIELRLAILLDTDVTFEKVAKLNAAVMTDTGKPINIKSTAPIWVYMNL